MHKNCVLLFEKYAKKYFKDNMRVLEIGPNDFPSTFEKVIGKKSIKWDTIDLRSDSRVTYQTINEYEFPIEDNYYDIIISGNVIEHVRKIWIWMKELSRVCKYEGLVITINPVSHPFHRIPYDCWRIYPEGMKALYEEAGLKLLISACDSLESGKLFQKGYRNIVFGRPCPPVALVGTWEFLKNSLKNLKNPKEFGRFALANFKRFTGWPISSSLDTISIGKKIDQK